MTNAHQRPLGQFHESIDLLGRLPRVVRYLDDFADKWRTLNVSEHDDSWQIRGDGKTYRLSFNQFKDEHLQHLIKHWTLWMLQSLSTQTVHIYQFGLRSLSKRIGSERIAELVSTEPVRLNGIWYNELVPTHSRRHLLSLKSLLFFCCDTSIFEWSPEHVDYIGSFKLPNWDKYARVRSGEVFLSSSEEAAIVDHLDLTSQKVLDLTSEISFEELQLAVCLAICYQHAMRPGQLAKVRFSDIRTYTTNEEGTEGAVHITFVKAKQRTSGKRLPTTRKIKRDWSPVFLKLFEVRKADPQSTRQANALEDSFVGLTPQGVTKAIKDITMKICGTARTPNELRHTAAQRLVDSGASREELATFLGHTYADTALVYFDISPTQADRVNKALGLSPVYSKVAEVAKTKTIDMEELSRVPPDHQIGGVPHGIPIAGIGACQLGQSLCRKNPILSCYNCPKFMAVRDAEIHQDVVSQIQSVVHLFRKASHDERETPAYMQLRQTLDAANSVILELQGRKKSGKSDE